MEAAREDTFAERDVALAVRGLVDVLLGTEDSALVVDAEVGSPLPTKREDVTFFSARIFPDILTNVGEGSGPWTASVTPHLLRLVAERATKSKRITYGEAATTLEAAGLATRAWPRTLYGMPLGAICNALLILGQQAGVRIPLLSTIVVKASGQPGEGINGMIRDFVKQYEESDQAKELLIRLKRDREGLIAELQQEVFAFQHWAGVLRALGLQKG